MKKLLNISTPKILIMCAVGLAMTIGSFWHHQSNQSYMDRMTTLNQGIATCFNRVSQTFVAMMVRDVNSPYLNRGFLTLSDECLNETIKGINPFKQNVGKGYQTLNKLISDVHWFHESTLKTHAPMMNGKNLDAPLNPLSAKFTEMEGLKVNLVDEVDVNIAKIKQIQANDEMLMGIGLLIFTLGLSLLSLQEFNKNQNQKDLEREALNVLNAGQSNVGAIVDQLVVKGLLNQNLVVSAQVFKDYHADILEKKSPKKYHENKAPTKNEVVEEDKEELTYLGPKTSFKDVLNSLENVHEKNLLQISDARDVTLAIESESLEQLMNAAVNKMIEKRIDKKRILITNQIHSDRAVVNFFLAGNTFNASELEYASGTVSSDGVDMNLMIINEMAQESDAQWIIENKVDREGMITGMSIRLTLKRTPKETKKNLVSVVRGKKKDLVREMMN